MNNAVGRAPVEEMVRVGVNIGLRQRRVQHEYDAGNESGVPTCINWRLKTLE